jgi:hypothetical protein
MAEEFDVLVADDDAICILLERSTAAPGLVTRPIEGLYGNYTRSVLENVVPHCDN